TLKLASIAIVLAILIGIPLGLLAAMKPDTSTDFAVRLLAIFGFAVPNFWFAIVLILVFGVALRVLPTQGYGSPRNFVLPAVTLTMPLMAVLASIVRAKALEVMREDYVRTAYAKGLHQRTVVFRHVLK